MRRFNRRIKRQQTRLHRQAVQHADDASDIAGGRDDLLHLVFHIVDFVGAVTHQRIRGLRVVRRLLRVCTFSTSSDTRCSRCDR